MAVAVGAVAYSALLFSLTSPEMSDIVKQGYGESESGTGNTISLMQLIVVLEFAFAEEIVFRLGIQNYLAKQLNWRGGKYWIAVTLTAALWTSAHTGVLEPDWVKLVQVFPVGLALGWLFRKLGTESCILAHTLFNVVMAFVSPFVLG
jgi:membrane protease YdiL (CAAX protease family)